MNEESRPNSDFAGTPYQLFMLALCFYVLVALAIQTFFHVSEGTSLILDWVDNAICGVFIADFTYGLVRAPNRRNFIKWNWIDLVSSIPNVSILRWGRAARIIRILRVLRAVRSTKFIATFLLKRRSSAVLATAAIVFLLMTVFGSIAILQLENVEEANIKNPEDALWWAFVTMTTVGYGDKYPVTTEGRLIAAILMTVGVGLFGTFTGLVASWFLSATASEDTEQMECVLQELREIKEVLKKREQE